MTKWVAEGNDFYENENKIAETLVKVQELNKELKAFGDRYTFYTMLLNAQAKEPSLKGAKPTSHPFGENGGSTGYATFNVSNAVAEDIVAGKKDETKKFYNLNVGWYEWWPELKADDGYLFCWFHVDAKHPGDNIREVVDSPAVGRKKVQFHFQAGYDKDADWKIESQTMRFKRSLYPFFGLKD